MQPGIFFADITTGAIEGWQLPLNPDANWANLVAVVSISPDGRFILYPATGTEDNRKWNLLDAQTGKTCALPDVRDLGWDGAFSPDGQNFVANTVHGIARLRSDCTAGLQSLGLPADAEVAYASWSPDGKALLVVTHRNLPETKAGRLVTSYLISPALKDPLVVDQGQGQPVQPEWSPDGAHVVVVSPSWGKIQVLDQAGRVLWATSLTASFVFNPRWSPDGRSIGLHADVYSRRESDIMYMPYAYVLDAEAGKTRFRVVGATAACGQIWAADSRSFLVWSHSSPSGYYLIAADGSALRHLNADPRGYAAFLSLSPKDASRAVIHQWNSGPGRESLKVMDLKTGLQTPLMDATESLGWDWRHPSRLWLSDGRLVFSTPHAGHGWCARDVVVQEFRVEFPPFPDIQPVRPPKGK
ncbi:MAG: hypothetical protein AB1566_15645 [Chloroflexota bacterium]